jgi:hypothetical protein
MIPPVSERKVKRWLTEDLGRLERKAASELDVKIVGKDDITPELLNVIIQQPIKLGSGVILKDNNLLKDNNPIQNLIDSKDYFVERGLDDKIKYSIHVFVIIFLCKNFLSYYKCYWNFIKGAVPLIETGEYFYDTIVSVGTKESFFEVDEKSLSVITDTSSFDNNEESSSDSEEKSSYENSLNEKGKKLLLKTQILQINTMDANGFKFPAISYIRRNYNLDEEAEDDNSEVKSAARNLRRFLRQRRIDLQITKPFDADD